MDAVTRMVELAVTIAVCSGVVDVLCCDMVTASLDVSVGEIKLDKIKSIEDNDADNGVVGGIKLPARFEELLDAEGATVLSADGENWSPSLNEKELDELEYNVATFGLHGSERAPVGSASD